MLTSIYKITIPVYGPFSLKNVWEILKVGEQNNIPVLWYEHAEENVKEGKYTVKRTGELVDTANHYYVGSFQIVDSMHQPYVGHLYQVFDYAE